MNRPSFESTVNVLVKAYLNDTLEHSVCGCAVHNIIQSKYKKKVEPYWANVFVTLVSGFRCFNPYLYKGRAKKQIDATGYTVRELSDIEYAFERERSSRNIFKCLLNVIDVLADIHNVDLSVKENAKLLFQK